MLNVAKHTAAFALGSSPTARTAAAAASRQKLFTAPQSAIAPPVLRRAVAQTYFLIPRELSEGKVSDNF